MPSRFVPPGLALACVILAAGAASGQQQDSAGERVLLRLAADSAVVGAFRFTSEAKSQLQFDIPADDPRTELLASVTAPRTMTRDIAGTVVSTPAAGDAERRYIIYWLGYRLVGEQGRNLTGLQWDSIFQAAGRRAELRFSARGQPLGVTVSSDAVQPVAKSLASILSGLALTLPADSVAEGNLWQDELAVPVVGPDGSQVAVVLNVTYQLSKLIEEHDGLKAHIEFDGEPVGVVDRPNEVTGKYFGESVFSVGRGRYEQVMAIANLEVSWDGNSGLPPSRTVVEWHGTLTRH